MPTWIRVRDDDTGAEYDVAPTALRDGMTRVEGYPVLSGPGARPRPTKVRVAKDGTPTVEVDQTPPAVQHEEPAPPADHTEEQQS